MTLVNGFLFLVPQLSGEIDLAARSTIDRTSCTQKNTHICALHTGYRLKITGMAKKSNEKSTRAMLKKGIFCTLFRNGDLNLCKYIRLTFKHFW